MKTVVLTESGLVQNVGVGVAASAPPPGVRYVFVEDDVHIGVGFMQADDGSFYNPKDTSEPQA
jgi:hypothetical protein